MIRKILRLIALLVAIFPQVLTTAQAQIGWTLEQCRKHFGHELKRYHTWMISETDPGPTFGIKYRYYTHQENLKRDAPTGSFDGLLVRVRFDSDGTVGKIQWETSGAFSNQEIKQLLKKSSTVSWSPAPASPLSEWGMEEEQRPTDWVGEHNGAILFDAKEDFDYFDGGHDSLTVTTRQLY
jgi:hypothetical protein